MDASVDCFVLGYSQARTRHAPLIVPVGSGAVLDQNVTNILTRGLSKLGFSRGALSVAVASHLRQAQVLRRPLAVQKAGAPTADG